MEVGDLVIATRKNGRYLLGWGRITGEYRYDPDARRYRIHISRRWIGSAAHRKYHWGRTGAAVGPRRG